MIRRLLSSTLFPYTTLFRSRRSSSGSSGTGGLQDDAGEGLVGFAVAHADRGRAHLRDAVGVGDQRDDQLGDRSEEHTSELQSHSDLVCRLLPEKEKLRKPAP